MEYMKLVIGIGLTMTLAWMLVTNSILQAYFSHWKSSVSKSGVNSNKCVR